MYQAAPNDERAIVDDAHLVASLRSGGLREHRFTNLELKSSWDAKHGKKLSALANRALHVPHWFVLGVDDNGQLLRLAEGWAKATEEQLSQAINDKLDPSLACTSIRCIQLPTGWIVAATLSNPGVVVRWDRRAYKAAGTTVADMSPDEEMQMTISLPGLADFSKQVCEQAPDVGLASRFLGLVRTREGRPGSSSSLSLDDVHADFLNLRLWRTQAARVLFGRCSFRVIRYDAQDRVLSNETKVSLYRLLDPELRMACLAECASGVKTLPSELLREACANMVAHAAYFDRDGDLMLETWPNRVCFSNLCARDCAYFANKWFSRKHHSPNPLLMESLRAAELVDELGRGKTAIFAEALRHGLPPPFVQIDAAGRTSRWRLFVYTSDSGAYRLPLLNALRQHYDDEQTALLACALVLWSNQGVTNYKEFIDGDCIPLFERIARDQSGPVAVSGESTLSVRRWAKVLIETGGRTKKLLPGEEIEIYEEASTAAARSDGVLTSRQIRQIAGLGDSSSEKSQCSRIVADWISQGKAKRRRRGYIEFSQGEPAVNVEELLRVFIERLRK